MAKPSGKPRKKKKQKTTLQRKPTTRDRPSVDTGATGYGNVEIGNVKIHANSNAEFQSAAVPGYTPSVASALDRIGTKNVVPAATIVITLLNAHPDYGGGLGGSVEIPESTQGEVHTARDWVNRVREFVRPEFRVHGRLAILGLALVEPRLGEILQQNGLLGALVSELKEPLEKILTDEAYANWRDRFGYVSTAEAGQVRVEGKQPDVQAGETPRVFERVITDQVSVSDQASVNLSPDSAGPPPLSDNVPTHADHPALKDELGRQGFARALAARIQGINEDEKWETVRQQYQPISNWNFLRGKLTGAFRRLRAMDRQVETRSTMGPFVLHIHGPWGSGKTSLLEFIRQDLQGDASTPWVVVKFNAWLHQRVGPPWWALMNEFYNQARSQLVDRDPDRARSLAQNQNWWWFGAGWGPYALAGGGLLWLLSTGAVSTISAAVTVGGAVFSLARFMLLGSARGATAALEIYRDPLRPLVRHFKKLVLCVGRPVAIFIDDLDRCDCEYVVKLLQGIQTLFSDLPIVYIVAADRRWLQASYENMYKDFNGFVGEPGRPLGYLFLEKVFQLSASIPRLPDQIKEKYWERLLGISQQNIESQIEEARRTADCRRRTL